MGETKGSLVRITLAALYLTNLARCHLNLDPTKDPVLQRLDIPAQEQGSEQDFALEPKLKASEKSHSIVRRLWGIPDVVAEIGKPFNLALPSDAFEGLVSRYEVASSDSGDLPSWLHFDREKGALWGRPEPDHVGNWYIKVRACGARPHHVATDVFAIQVVNETCDHLSLSLTFDLDWFTVSAKSRSRLVSSLSRHFRVSDKDVTLKEARRAKPAEWIKAGAGNVLLPVHSHLTNARVRFPCSLVNDTQLWDELKKQAVSGELADRLGHSLTGWFLVKAEAEPGRLRREIGVEGSGDDENYDYEEFHEEDEDLLPDTPVIPSQRSPVVEEPQPTPTISSSATVDAKTATSVAVEPTKIPLTVTSVIDSEVEPTPILNPSTTSATPVIEHSEVEPVKDPLRPRLVEEPVPVTAFPDELEENEVEDTEEDLPKTPHNSAPQVTKRLPRLTVTAGKILRFTISPETFTDAEDGSARSLKLRLIPSEGRELADIPWIGFNAAEQTIYGLPLAEDIGKWNFFLEATDKKGASVQEMVEIQVRQHQSERSFNHRFSVKLKAEFSEDEMSIPRALWLIKIVESIYNTTHDRSSDSIVVRSLAGDIKNDQPFSLSWVNESLPRQHCPEDEIHEIVEKFYNAETAEITPEFEDVLPLQFLATSVTADLEGICKQVPTAPTVPILKEIPDVTEKTNAAPQVRNPVDHIEAEAGVLLRYQVPEDTFFDVEDGNTRMLRLQLLSSERQPLDSKWWLQFDAANQEFYGLPLESDAGSEDYQLRASDTGGLSTHDGLVVAVKPRPKEESFSVEFSLTINADFESVMTSAHRKARLVETIAQIFGDSDPRNVVIKALSKGSTVVSWSNKSLPVSPCPQADILQLRRALLDEEGKVTSRASDLLSGADFEPVSAALLPLGACVGELTPTHAPDADAEEAETEKPEGGSSWTDDYLLTFIVPGIIIAAMLLLAAVIACILYRRRRTGKLGLEERRSFVSKGIPIIFAEELEERPSSGRHSVKSPVILKDERPAQPPPDYRKVRSSASPATQHVPPEQRDLLRSPSDETPDDDPAAPYQPPPPLAAGSGRDSGKSGRPKATPAYRKPPPYVPP